MDANEADRLAQTNFGDDYILLCGIYFATGGYTYFFAKRHLPHKSVEKLHR